MNQRRKKTRSFSLMRSALNQAHVNVPHPNQRLKLNLNPAAASVFQIQEEVPLLTIQLSASSPNQELIKSRGRPTNLRLQMVKIWLLKCVRALKEFNPPTKKTSPQWSSWSKISNHLTRANSPSSWRFFNCSKRPFKNKISFPSLTLINSRSPNRPHNRFRTWRRSATSQNKSNTTSSQSTPSQQESVICLAIQGSRTRTHLFCTQISKRVPSPICLAFVMDMATKAKKCLALWSKFYHLP